MKLQLYCLIAIITLSVSRANAQYSAIRVNTLGLATGTINVGVDVAVADKWSIDFSAYYNPIPKINTLAFTAGVRRWRFEPHVGAFWGLHSTTARYDIGNNTNHYKGWLSGVGATYGYSWMLSTRWNFTLEGGLGVFYMQDKKQARYTPPMDDIFIYHYRRVVVAPSKLEISFSYLF